MYFYFCHKNLHLDKIKTASLEIQPFYLVNKAHPKMIKGFPLDSLSVDIQTGKYYNDLEDELAVDKSTIEIGFTNFFENF